MTSVQCNEACCGEGDEAQICDASSPGQDCRDGCCGETGDDVSSAAPPSLAQQTQPAAACADRCCSINQSQPAIVVKSCRAEEYPSCCSEAICRALSAPLCCSAQVNVAPSPSSATSLASTIKPIDQRGWRQIALFVSFATVVWNIIEGTLSVVYGAENVSVSLLGFGADSWVEVLSAIVVAHRFWTQESNQAQTTHREKRATLIIGSLLIILAVSIAGGSIAALSLHETPDSSIASLAIASTAIAVMTALYFIKVHVAFELSSSTMESDAQCSLCCIQLSSVLFVGSLVYHFAGDAVWWFDGATAVVIALLVGREGVNAVRNARRPDFNGCGCCDENSGWYISWLRKRRQSAQ